MPEKKVVIRLNYSSDNRPKAVSKPEVITEWNIRRIAGAVLILMLLAGATFWFLWKQNTPTESEVPLVVAESKPEEVKPPLSSSIPKSGGAVREEQSDGEANSPQVQAVEAKDVATVKNLEPASLRRVTIPRDPRIVQAVLSKAVYNRQPVGVIEGIVHAEPDRAVGVFYFTELKSMKGQKVTHEWWRGEKLIFKKSVTLRHDPGTFYTSKLVNTRMLGTWQVYLKDSQGRILDIHSFELLPPP